MKEILAEQLLFDNIYRFFVKNKKRRGITQITRIFGVGSGLQPEPEQLSEMEADRIIKIGSSYKLEPSGVYQTSREPIRLVKLSIPSSRINNSIPSTTSIAAVGLIKLAVPI